MTEPRTSLTHPDLNWRDQAAPDFIDHRVVATPEGGVCIELTEAERAQLAVEQWIWHHYRAPLEAAVAELAALDQLLRRETEDTWAATPGFDYGALAPAVRARLARKQALRAALPGLRQALADATAAPDQAAALDHAAAVRAAEIAAAQAAADA